MTRRMFPKAGLMTATALCGIGVVSNAALADQTSTQIGSIERQIHALESQLNHMKHDLTSRNAEVKAARDEAATASRQAREAEERMGPVRYDVNGRPMAPQPLSAPPGYGYAGPGRLALHERQRLSELRSERPEAQAGPVRARRRARDARRLHRGGRRLSQPQRGRRHRVELQLRHPVPAERQLPSGRVPRHRAPEPHLAARRRQPRRPHHPVGLLRDRFQQLGRHLELHREQQLHAAHPRAERRVQPARTSTSSSSPARPGACSPRPRPV